MAGFDNEVMFSSGERLESVTALSQQLLQSAATDVGKVSYSGDPEGVISCNPSSLSHDPTTGNIYYKASGTGNTGWKLISSFDTACANYIVDPSGDKAAYTTIASALAAASSGDTIFVKPGTYTEDLTLKAGVDLVSFQGESEFSQVEIVGKLTATYSGNATISGIRLTTNSDYALELSGANTTNLQLNNCYIDAADATGVLVSNANAQLGINNSILDQSGAAVKLFDISNGNVTVRRSRITNSGAGTTDSTVSAGALNFVYCACNIGVTTSGSGSLVCSYSTIDQVARTALTHGGSVRSFFRYCTISTTTATAVTIAAGTKVTMYNCIVSSGNAAVISGAGELEYSPIVFNNGYTVTVTTQTLVEIGPSVLYAGERSGGSVSSKVSNTSNTASSTAYYEAQVAGATANDAYYNANIASGQNWSWGLDNSDSDAYILAASSALGTTNVMRASTAGEVTFPLQPAFAAFLPSDDLNVTGNGSAYTLGSPTALTEIYDVNSDFNTNGTFTAPVTGKYRLGYYIKVDQATGATSATYSIVTSNRTYTRLANVSSLASHCLYIDCLCDMDASDTATFTISLTGIGADTADVDGGAVQLRSMCWGHLVC